MVRPQQGTVKPTWEILHYLHHCPQNGTRHKLHTPQDDTAAVSPDLRRFSTSSCSSQSGTICLSIRKRLLSFDDEDHRFNGLVSRTLIFFSTIKRRQKIEKNDGCSNDTLQIHVLIYIVTVIGLPKTHSCSHPNTLET